MNRTFDEIIEERNRKLVMKKLEIKNTIDKLSDLISEKVDMEKDLDYFVNLKERYSNN